MIDLRSPLPFARLSVSVPLWSARYGLDASQERTHYQKKRVPKKPDPEFMAINAEAAWP